MKKKTVICLVALFALTIFLTACTSGPSDVARDYMDAFSKGDMNGMVDCMDPDSAALIKGVAGIAASQFGLDADSFLGISPGLFSIMDAYFGYEIDYRITDEQIYGDKAIVTIEYDVNTDGEARVTGEVREIPLVKIDGKWYVSELG